MSETHLFDAELRDLWSRRRDLDEAGWTRLCVIVITVLRAYRPPELAGLPEDREIYVQEFIEDKVWRIDSLSGCDHVGALRLYYVNYLRDQIRSKKTRSKLEVADEHDPDSKSPPSLDETPAVETDARDPLTELEEAGFSPTKVAESAAAWLAGSEEWVRLFIALSNCPDAELSEPLIRLAKRKGIKSRHSRATQIGFNWRGDDFKGFENTMLGRWIVESLNIKILPENSPLIHGALKILCFEALSWAEQQEAAP